MKTIYVKPETTIVKVSFSTLLAASSPQIVSKGTADTTTQQDGDGYGYMLSRESNSLWDDEE